MEHTLKSYYCCGVATVAVLWAACRLAQVVAADTLLPAPGAAAWGPAVFILTAACAVAAPIVYRTLFALACRGKTRVNATAFLRFERRLILLGVAALALALAADLLALPFFHRAGTLLMALYAVYWAFPSKQRLALDRRLFRAARPPEASTLSAPNPELPEMTSTGNSEEPSWPV